VRNKQKQAFIQVSQMAALSLNLIVETAPSERVVWTWHLTLDFNGCLREVRCTALRRLLQVRKNAASAMAA